MRHRLVLLALLLPIVGACSSDSASDASTPPAATTASTSGAAAAPTTVADAPAPTEVTPTDAGGTTPAAPAAPASSGAVGIADFKFDPPTINVPVGGSVVWTNNDTQQHTATSSGNFDAGAIQPGTSVTVEFKTAGSFAYICSFHPFMMGTVVVG
jgi:plastocyanin